MTIEILFRKLQVVFSMIASESIAIEHQALRAVAAAHSHGTEFPHLVNVNLRGSKIASES
jgi:hypothetical protein